VLEGRERGIGRDQFEVERLPVDLVDHHEHASSDNLRVRVVVIELDEESVLEGNDSRIEAGRDQRPRSRAGRAVPARSTTGPRSRAPWPTLVQPEPR
jgi:hypothetical protein